MKKPSILSFLFSACLAGTLLSCRQTPDSPTNQNSDNTYRFERGYPSGDTAQKAYDDADLNTAIDAYKFFYPSVSILATWKGNEAAGVVSNKSFLILQGSPHQLVFTPNSDTPYEGANIDLSSGPMVVELPPGPLMWWLMI